MLSSFAHLHTTPSRATSPFALLWALCCAASRDKAFLFLFLFLSRSRSRSRFRFRCVIVVGVARGRLCRGRRSNEDPNERGEKKEQREVSCRAKRLWDDAEKGAPGGQLLAGLRQKSRFFLLAGFQFINCVSLYSSGRISIIYCIAAAAAAAPSGNETNERDEESSRFSESLRRMRRRMLLLLLIIPDL